MKKVFLFITIFMVFTLNANALSIESNSEATRDMYGFVSAGNSINWNENWYYIQRSFPQNQDCKNVKIILSSGLSFSSTEKITTKDLGEYCEYDESIPGDSAPVILPLKDYFDIEKIYVDNDATPGIKKITVKFGTEDIDNNINIMVVNKNNNYELLHYNNRTINLADYTNISDNTIITGYDGYLFYNQGKEINTEDVYVRVNDIVLLETDTYKTNTIMKMPPLGGHLYTANLSNISKGVHFAVSYIKSLSTGDYDVEFVFSDGSVVKSKLTVINDENYSDKTYNVIQGANQVMEYTNSNDIKPITFKLDGNMDDFSEITIDDDYVLQKYYTISKKDNTITLSKEFLQKIKYSGHDFHLNIEFIFKDGSVRTKFIMRHQNSKINELLNGKYTTSISNLNEDLIFYFNSSNNEFLKYFDKDSNKIGIYVNNSMYDYYGLFDEYYEISKTTNLSKTDKLKKSFLKNETYGTIKIKKELLEMFTEGEEYRIAFVFDGEEVVYAYIKIKDGKANTISFKEGAKQTIDLKKNRKLVFKLDANIDDFSELYIDNVIIPKKYYTLTEGSTVITFSEDFMYYLNNGSHTLKVNFKDGNASTTFTVANADANNPETGTFLNISIIGLAILGLVLIKTNKKKLYKI